MGFIFFIPLKSKKKLLISFMVILNMQLLNLIEWMDGEIIILYFIHFKTFIAILCILTFGSFIKKNFFNKSDKPDKDNNFLIKKNEKDN